MLNCIRFFSLFFGIITKFDKFSLNTNNDITDGKVIVLIYFYNSVNVKCCALPFDLFFQKA